MKPYRFTAYLKETIWGGARLAAYKGVATDLKTVGESWELSGVGGHESVVVPNGTGDDADVGLSLSALIGRHGEALVGTKVRARFGNEFPLLVKFIDAEQDLSVQVHPDDALAEKRHGCRGKTEMWYLIDSVPGAKIYAGLRTALTPDDYVRLMASAVVPNPIHDALAVYDAHPGDLYFLPAGQLHAIGGGNLLVEIQETSDITYRVYDYGRRDAKGRTRELQTELAKEAIDYSMPSRCRVPYAAEKPVSELVRCSHFVVTRVLVDGVVRLPPADDSFVIVICLGGAALVNGVSVRQGETLLVPACASALDLRGQATLLTAALP